MIRARVSSVAVRAWLARGPAGAIIALLIGLVAAACSMDGTPCAPGDYRYCDCASGRQGYAQCALNGAGYGDCDCSGTIPPGSGVLVEAGVPEASNDAQESGGLAGFLATCMTDDDCESHLCFQFNAFGPHCSIPCAKDLDCPAPSPGCSGKGVCKLH